MMREGWGGGSSCDQMDGSWKNSSDSQWISRRDEKDSPLCIHVVLLDSLIIKVLTPAAH
jgi:hypothetical protein